MKPQTRNATQMILFGFGAVVVGWFTYHSFVEENTENIIASVSLLIALISMFVTTLAYNQQLDSKLPQIVIDADFRSRYGLIVLSIKNMGEKTAFDVRIRWDRPILNYKGEHIFGQVTDNSHLTILPALQMGQELKITIDEISHFYSRYDDNELQYFGTVTYSLSKTSDTSIRTNFNLDLSVFRKTLYYENESLKAAFELQKVPKALEEIKEELKRKRKE